MAETTGLLNLHTGNRITSSNLVLSAQCKASGTLHECAAFLRLWVSPSRARSRKEMPMNAKRALWARSLMLCSRTHRDVAGAGGQISSETIPSPLLRLSAKVSISRPLSMLTFSKFHVQKHLRAIISSKEVYLHKQRPNGCETSRITYSL